MNVNEPKSEMEVYGVQDDPEKLNEWVTFQVLMMNSQGAHKLLKVCIHEKETVNFIFYKRTDIWAMAWTNTIPAKIKLAHSKTLKKGPKNTLKPAGLINSPQKRVKFKIPQLA